LDRAAQRAGRPALGVAAHRERLAHWQATLAPRVQATLTAQSQRLDRLGLRAQAAMTRRQELQAQRLAQWAARLSSVDPSRVLRRGYAWITDAEGKPLQSTQAVVPGDAIRAVLADGSIDAAVIAVDRQAKPI
jgi:exodeoxyribonuclease VII large subunit